MRRPNVVTGCLVVTMSWIAVGHAAPRMPTDAAMRSQSGWLLDRAPAAAAPRVLMDRAATAAQTVPGGAAAVTDGGESLPVADWLAWRVFHESLTFYRTRSAVDVERMLAERAGLSAGETAVLHAAGEAFVGALAQIDAAARAEVQGRYGSPRSGPDASSPRPSGAPGSRPAGPAIGHAPGTTLFDRVRESGLYDAVEASKDAALAAHLTHLQQTLGGGPVAGLTALVRHMVAPKIRTGLLRPPAPPALLPPPGAVRTPPPGARIRPSDVR